MGEASVRSELNTLVDLDILGKKGRTRSMRYVFRHREGMSRRREFVIFIVLSVLGLIINDALMWVGTELAGIDYRIVKLFATAVVMVWNFVSRKVLLDGSGNSGR